MNQVPGPVERPINDGLMKSEASAGGASGGPAGPKQAQSDAVKPNAFGRDPYDVPSDPEDEEADNLPMAADPAQENGGIGAQDAGAQA